MNGTTLFVTTDNGKGMETKLRITLMEGLLTRHQKTNLAADTKVGTLLGIITTMLAIQIRLMTWSGPIFCCALIGLVLLFWAKVDFTRQKRLQTVYTANLRPQRTERGARGCPPRP